MAYRMRSIGVGGELLANGKCGGPCYVRTWFPANDAAKQIPFEAQS